MIDMFKLFYILLLSMQTWQAEEPNPPTYEPDDMFSDRAYLALDYQSAGFYYSQIKIDIGLYNGKGLYKDIYVKALEVGYAARLQKNEKVVHRFDFMLLNYQGLYYKALLDYGHLGDNYTIGEYLFWQNGIKVLDWSNINDFTDFTPLELSTELVLEDRNKKSPISNHYNIKNMPNLHSFYLIPRLNLGVSRIAIDDEIKKAYLQSIINSFWDVPIGGQLELGYDWTRVINKTYDTPSGQRTSQRVVTNEFKILTDYKLYPLNDMKRLSYGFKADIDPYVEDIIGFYLDIHLSYNKNKIQIPGKSYSYDSFSIGLSN